MHNKVQERVQEQVSQSQREYLLREQMKAIQKELGESDDSQAEIDELRTKLDESGDLPKRARNAIANSSVSRRWRLLRPSTWWRELISSG